VEQSNRIRVRFAPSGPRRSRPGYGRPRIRPLLARSLVLGAKGQGAGVRPWGASNSSY
jgi:hypothetical protein